MGQTLSVVVAVGIPLGAGLGVGAAINHQVKGWYKHIKKPSWNPPNWVFGPMWSALYTMMGVASWKVWRAGGGALPLTLYGVQLALNLAWSPIFFQRHQIGFALLDISALLGVLAATMVEFHKVSPGAAYLLAPYFAWTTYATALNYRIYKDNPGERGALDFEDAAAEAAKQTREAAAVAGAKIQEGAAIVQEKASEAASSVPKLDLGEAKEATKEKAGEAKAGAHESAEKARAKAS